MPADIEAVKTFWENNPLFSGESKHVPGSREFFEEHARVYYEDCHAGNLDEATFIPESLNGKVVLDLGCGVGFWTIEIQKRRRCRAFYSGDLTEAALCLTRKRLECYGLSAELSQQNAEAMTYPDGFFDHVNCQGVVHHTPDTERAVHEIARVLRPGGTASISVYYRNIFVRAWPIIAPMGRCFARLSGAKFKGRGREDIFSEMDTDKLIRLYDGAGNPVGKAYSRAQFMQMAGPYFKLEKTKIFFFPARAMPFRMPRWLHRMLADYFGFMVNFSLVRNNSPVTV